MNFRSKSKLHQHLGRPNFFRKTVEVKKSVRYVELEGNGRLLRHGEGKLLSLNMYPKGILFTDHKEVFIGLKFEEIKELEVIRTSSEEGLLVVRMHLSQPFEFTIVHEHHNNLLYQLRLTQLRFIRSHRELEKTKEDLSDLATDFSHIDTATSLQFQLLDISTFGNVALLDIQPDTISWKGETMNLCEAIGFSCGITLNKSHGGTHSRDFDIIVHIRNKDPFRISFSKKAGISTLNQDESAFEEIINILFNLISRKYVVDWLFAFSKNEVVEYKEYSISKEGIFIKNGKLSMLMFWDEIVVSSDIIRWKYNNRAFVRYNGYYDRRTVMLVKFLNWLNEDEKRMNQMLGTDNTMTSSNKMKAWTINVDSVPIILP